MWIVSASEASISQHRPYYHPDDVNEDGDCSTFRFPNGVNAIYQNGLVSYEYPQSVVSDPNHVNEYDGGDDGDGHTMFSHIVSAHFPSFASPQLIRVK